MIDEAETIELVQDQPAQYSRRNIFKQALALILGGLSGVVPLGIGLRVFLDPLSRKSQMSQPVRVASLDALPNDDMPHKFTVIADQEDAWTKISRTPVGAVYLRRTGDQTLQALNVVCPHAGCFVDFNPSLKTFLCPCHHSSFTLDGAIYDPHSPSPRGLDSLNVEIRNGAEIWVGFRNFVAGQKEKIPIA